MPTSEEIQETIFALIERLSPFAPKRSSYHKIQTRLSLSIHGTDMSDEKDNDLKEEDIKTLDALVRTIEIISNPLDPMHPHHMYQTLLKDAIDKIVPTLTTQTDKPFSKADYALIQTTLRSAHLNAARTEINQAQFLKENINMKKEMADLLTTAFTEQRNQRRFHFFGAKTKWNAIDNTLNDFKNEETTADEAAELLKQIIYETCTHRLTNKVSPKTQTAQTIISTLLKNENSHLRHAFLGRESDSKFALENKFKEIIKEKENKMLDDNQGPYYSGY